MCSVMKFTLKHTTTVMNIMGKVFYDDFLGFAKTPSIFLNMLEIPDICWGYLSGQIFLGVQSRCWGRKKSKYLSPPGSSAYAHLAFPWCLIKFSHT